jgi:hypothetical protein
VKVENEIEFADLPIITLKQKPTYVGGKYIAKISVKRLNKLVDDLS